jgi:WD40-like Beta Propeller Repeat
VTSGHCLDQERIKKPVMKYVLYVLTVLLLVGAGAAVVVFVASNPSARPTALPDGSPSSTAAAFVKQHSLLLINESPQPGKGGSGPMTSSIYTVHTDGTGKTVLTNDGGAPSWTPDGKIIFASSRSGSQQIWIMDANRGNAHQIGDLPTSTLPVMPQEGGKRRHRVDGK